LPKPEIQLLHWALPKHLLPVCVCVIIPSKSPFVYWNCTCSENCVFILVLVVWTLNSCFPECNISQNIVIVRNLVSPRTLHFREDFSFKLILWLYIWLYMYI